MLTNWRGGIMPKLHYNMRNAHFFQRSRYPTHLRWRHYYSRPDPASAWWQHYSEFRRVKIEPLSARILVNEDVWEDLSHHMHFVTETWEEMNPDKEARLMILFSITQEELDVVGRDRMKDLILERIALLHVNR